MERGSNDSGGFGGSWQEGGEPARQQLAETSDTPGTDTPDQNEPASSDLPPLPASFAFTR